MTGEDDAAAAVPAAPVDDDRNTSQDDDTDVDFAADDDDEDVAADSRMGADPRPGATPPSEPAAPFGNGEIAMFGKLPAHRDFVDRGIPDFGRAWDSWYQRTQPEAQERLGGGWDAAYKALAPWNFFFPPGGLGRSAWIGAWIASVDGVGRLYPFVVAFPVEDVRVAARLVAMGWFERLDRLLVWARDQRLSVDDLRTHIDNELGGQRGVLGRTVGLLAERQQRQAGNASMSAFPPHVPADLALAGLLQSMLTSRAEVRFWWTLPREQQWGVHSITRGWPDADALAAMLSVRMTPRT